MRNNHLLRQKSIFAFLINSLDGRKNHILLMLLLIIFLGVKANPVDIGRARQAAMAFLNNNGVRSAELINVSSTAGFSKVYVFTTKNSFVLIAADDCVQPILGYSMNGSFILENMPSNKRAWIQEYSDQIQSAVEHKTRASYEVTQQWRALAEGHFNTDKATAVVAPLIQTRWDQNEPYNNLCPNGTVTGCTATAMAQVMKYWNYPPSGIGMHSYKWNGQIVSADFGSTIYDWDNMLSTYNSNSTEAQKNAVATLMFHCGVSVNMNYGWAWSGGSSAYTSAVANAFINFFNYSTEIQLLNRSSYSDEEWINMVKAELNLNRPLCYYGQGSGGGHAFICDGYDNNGYFHFNWGWGGYCDEYYTINNLSPGPGGIGSGSIGEYNNNQQALFGVRPGPTSTVCAPVLTADLLTESGDRNVQLNWNEVDNAVLYNVYRNGSLIYTTTSGSETSYLDVHIDYGTTTYYIRSMDENGILSWPSNYAPVTIIFAAPTNLVAEQFDEGIQLSWMPCEGAIAYNVYCNNCLIENGIDQTTFQDIRTIAGDLSYYVRGVDVFGDLSESSDFVLLTIPYSKPIVDDLEASVSGKTIELSWSEPNWCYPETPYKTLNYGNDNYNGYFGYTNGGTYWGHRYPAEDLEAYSNMSFYKVSLYARVAGEYELLVYEGTTNGHPQTLICEQTVWIESEGWFDIDLLEKILIDTSHDYWVFFHDVDGIYCPGAYCSFSGNEGNYYSKNPTSSIDTRDGIAFLIHTYITDGTYTYNLYRNGTCIASNLNSIIYRDNNLSDGIYNYNVKTNYYAGETNASNLVSVHIGEVNNYFIITASVNPTQGGNVIGDGSYIYGQSCTMNASAATGYVFSNWTENGTIVSTNSNYTFTVSGNRDLIANFTNNIGVKEMESVDIALYPNPTKNKITIENSEPIHLLEIFTVNGSLVHCQKNCPKKTEICVENYPIGIYMIRLTTNNSIVFRRFVKE